MGRTKRRRIRRSLNQSINLDHESSLINLRKWLVHNKWHNQSQLRLQQFSETGRGVCSTKNIRANDVLIRIPYELVITYKTLELNGLLELVSLEDNSKFKMIDLMALFLSLEKQKGQKSKYKDYVGSLPCPEPALPWFCTPAELKLYPLDLQISLKKALAEYQESLLRVRGSISPSVRVTDRTYKWAFILVNTRAVYVDPMVCCGNSNPYFISDEPSMALCPFLDLFNHHYLAETDAEIVSVNGRPFYQLRTHTGTGKFEQIYICYGPHDNDKLLREYGFFVPGNVYDCVRFEFNEVKAVLGFSMDSRQFRFVKDHGFVTREKLFVTYGQISFGLKALLFVSCYNEARDYNATVFGDAYSEEFREKLIVMVRDLLSYKCKVFTEDYHKLSNCESELSESAKLMLTYLEYRVKFVKSVLNEYFRSKTSIPP